MSSFTAPTGGTFVLPPAGSHVARLIKIIDLGTQYNEMYQNHQHQIYWAFELPNKLMPPDETGKEQPFIASDFLTLSMNEKSRLRKQLEQWRGRGFTDKEAADFDIGSTLGKSCYMNIIHKPKKNGGGDKAELMLSPLPKEVECKPVFNNLLFFRLDEFDQTIFDGLSEGLKKKIIDSDEYKKISHTNAQAPSKTQTASGGAATTAGETEFFDDDIPF